jgi:photosystem II stability/assembly factor-like uncharacterized protein
MTRSNVSASFFESPIAVAFERTHTSKRKRTMASLRKECGLVVLLLCSVTGLSLGAEWKAINTGLTNMNIRSLAIDPANSLTVYAGTSNGVFKSTDGGATWHHSGLPDRATSHLVIDFVNPSILYAATQCTRTACFCSERFLFKSTDAGASWSDRVSPPDQACDLIRALLLDPSNPNTLYYAALNGNGFPPLSKSTDGGATWGYVPPWRYPTAPPFDDIAAIAINPLAPNNLYAAGWRFPDPSGVFKSIDGGVTWSRTGLTDTNVTVLAIDPRNSSTLYAGTQRDWYGPTVFQGLLKSTDNGATWFAINHGLSDVTNRVSALLVDPKGPSTLYAAFTGDGVFKSSDSGANWIRFSDGLGNRNVHALALTSGANGLNVLYAGTSGGGVFKVLDDGIVIDPVPVSRTFFVPVVVSSTGIGGAFYESELTLANRSAREATVEFTYTAASGGGSGQCRTTLEPGRQLIVPDAVAYLRQLGIPIPESGNHHGTLKVRFFGLASPDEAAVTVRTTTAVAGGRAGVAYPGVPMASLSDYGGLYGLRQDASYRTNLALQNAGEAQDGDITLRVYVFANNSAAEFPEILLHQVIPPGGFYQINDILHSHGLEISSGHVSLGRISGYAPFHAYAVTHHQTGSDAFYIQPASQSLSRLTIPTIPRRQDGFKGELVFSYLLNSLEDQRFSISFQAVEQETFPVKAEITLKPYEQRIVADVESWLKDFGLSLRQRPFQGVKGPLVFTMDRVGGEQGSIPLSLGMRVSTLNKGEEYSVFFPAVPAEQESRSATWLFGLQQNEETRSNLAIVNLGGELNRFTIELFDGKTGMQAGRVEAITVDPQASFQLNSLLADHTSGVAQGYARVTPSSSEPFIAYAVIIDGARPGERTGDASIVHSSP